MFAKIFESEKYGQILVKRGLSDDPEHEFEIRFYADMEVHSKHASVSSLATYGDDEDALLGAFADIDQECAEEAAKHLVDMTVSMFGDVEEDSE
jgi:hypothetical protein